MENKNFEKAVRRGLLHIFLSFIITLITVLTGRTFSLIFYSAITVGGFGCTIISRKRKIPGISWALDKFDYDWFLPGKGALMYMIGVVLTLALFPRDIALASILFLGVADGVAKIVGMKGKIKYPYSSKTFEGSFVGGVLGILSASIFVPIFPSFIAGVLTMIAESFKFPYWLDDNLILPLLF